MSIAEKLTYLQTTKQLLKTEINKINNVLDDDSTFRSYPQELFNGYLDILNNGTDTLWNNLEKVSQTGTEAVLENVETAPIKMVLNGNTSQDGEPTPDDPKTIHVVKGNNVVSVQGKNLVDYLDVKGVGPRDGTNNITLDSSSIDGDLLTITKTYQQGGGILKFNNISLPKIEQGEIVTISFIPNKTIRGVVGISNYNGGGTNNITTYADFVENSMFKISLEALSTYDKLGIFIQGLSQSVGIKNLLVEQNSTATPYIPYSHTDYPINLGDIELCKINTYKDFPFKAINGNEYYDTLTDEQKNALVYGSWYVHKEIGKVVLNENTIFEGYQSFGNYYRGQKKIQDAKIFENNNIEIFSNYFKGNINVFTSTKAEVGNMGQYKSTIDFYFISTQPTQADFKTWLSTHNTIFYYVLATPTEEEITNSTLIEQLEAIYKAKSVKDKTFITQTNYELPFILDVEAIKEYEVN